MSNLFTGVLVEENDPLSDAEWDALRQQLLDDEEGDLLAEDDGFAPTPVSSAFACLVYMAPGALVGILEASIFLVWLDAAVTLGTAASIFALMFGSFMTVFISYICFRLTASAFNTTACERRRIDHTIKYYVGEEEEDEEPTEYLYYFCVGVFIGFCTVCMAHQIMQGFPIGDILILTIAFASLMLFCASRQRQTASYQTKTPCCEYH
jgi:hypothetical protein